MPNPNILRKIVFPGAVVPYDADAQILFDRMATPPDATRKGLINDLILGLKDDGDWANLDVLVLLAAADSQASLLDWKNLSDGALVNAPAFVADRGYTGDGATSYINTQFNPSTDAVQYTQNSASYGFYSRLNIGENASMMGLATGGFLGSYLIPRLAENTLVCKINSDASNSQVSNNSQGLFSGERDVNNLEDVLRNAVSLGTQADTSQALVNGEFYFLCRNRLTVGAESFSTNQGAMYYLASGALNQLAFYNRIQTYLTSVGAAV